MGVVQKYLPGVIIVAACVLILLSVLPWGRVTTHGDLGGIGVHTIRGQDVHNVFGFGDGTAILLGAMTAIALVVYLGQASQERVRVGLGLALLGFGMSALAIYDCVSAGVADFADFGPGTIIGGSASVKLTAAPYFAAIDAFFLGGAGLMVAMLPRASGTSRTGEPWVGLTTRNSIAIVMWTCAFVAAGAAVLALDGWTLGFTGRNPGLGQAWLLAALAGIAAVAAWRMRTDPNEIAWGVLAVAGACVFSLALHMARNDGGPPAGWVMTGLFVLCGLLLWQFLIEPGHQVWQLLIGSCALLAAFGVGQFVTTKPGCNEGFLGFINVGYGCLSRSDLATGALWLLTAGGLVAAGLALALPMIESYARSRPAAGHRPS